MTASASAKLRAGLSSSPASLSSLREAVRSDSHQGHLWFLSAAARHGPGTRSTGGGGAGESYCDLPACRWHHDHHLNPGTQSRIPDPVSPVARQGADSQQILEVTGENPDASSSMRLRADHQQLGLQMAQQLDPPVQRTTSASHCLPRGPDRECRPPLAISLPHGMQEPGWRLACHPAPEGNALSMPSLRRAESPKARLDGTLLRASNSRNNLGILAASCSLPPPNWRTTRPSSTQAP